MRSKVYETDETKNTRILKELHTYYMSKTEVRDILTDEGYDGLVKELVKEIGFSYEDAEAIASHYMA